MKDDNDLGGQPLGDNRPPEEQKTPRSKRILAGIGVILMIFLVIMYTYSIASGKIFLW